MLKLKVSWHLFLSIEDMLWAQAPSSDSLQCVEYVWNPKVWHEAQRTQNTEWSDQRDRYSQWATRPCKQNRHSRAKGQLRADICWALCGPSYLIQLFKMTCKLNWEQTYRQKLGVWVLKPGKDTTGHMATAVWDHRKGPAELGQCKVEKQFGLSQNRYSSLCHTWLNILMSGNQKEMLDHIVGNQ